MAMKKLNLQYDFVHIHFGAIKGLDVQQKT